MLDFKQMHYFLAAYEERSISAAAIRCFIAQPSISHAIKSLEHKLNTLLFHRSKTGIAPTQAAHSFYPQAKALLQQTRCLEQQFAHNTVIDINVYFQGDISLLTLRPIINELRAMPHVHLNWVVELNQADLAFTDLEKIGKRFQGQTIYQEGFHLLVPDSHSLANTTKITLPLLNEQSFIERPYCSQKKAFQQLLKKENIELIMSAKADNDMQVMELVSLGFGLTAMPSHRLNWHPKGTIKKTITHTFHRNIAMAYRSSRHDIKPIVDNLNWPWIQYQIEP